MEIRHLHERLGISVVYVTHDQDEALTMSDRIAVFNQGRIEQVGTAAELYDNPTTLFVAGFVGETNLIEGRVIGADRTSCKVATAAFEHVATYVPGLATNAAVTRDSARTDRNRTGLRRTAQRPADSGRDGDRNDLFRTIPEVCGERRRSHAHRHPTDACVADIRLRPIRSGAAGLGTRKRGCHWQARECHDLMTVFSPRRDRTVPTERSARRSRKPTTDRPDLSARY